MGPQTREALMCAAYGLFWPFFFFRRRAFLRLVKRNKNKTLYFDEIYPLSLKPALPTFCMYVLFENSSIHEKKYTLYWEI